MSNPPIGYAPAFLFAQSGGGNPHKVRDTSPDQLLSTVMLNNPAESSRSPAVKSGDAPRRDLPLEGFLAGNSHASKSVLPRQLTVAFAVRTSRRKGSPRRHADDIDAQCRLRLGCARSIRLAYRDGDSNFWPRACGGTDFVFRRMEGPHNSASRFLRSAFTSSRRLTRTRRMRSAPAARRSDRLR